MKLKSLITLAIGIVALQSCTSKKTEDNQQKDSVTVNKIEKTAFGTLPDGRKADSYTLKNANGMVVKISNYGGVISYWTAPDKDGKYEDIVLGFDSLAGYLTPPPYFGAIIGRYGNRIAKGKFKLEDKEYTLATNNNNLNHLHGGVVGYDKVLWNAEPIEGEEPALRLTYLSKDGEEGYPGNLNVTVIYTLQKDNSLKIDYSATTDKTTIINLTNHSYFNLSASKNNILEHEVTLNADKFLPVDKGLIPTGELRAVTGTVFDFTKPTVIGKGINEVKDEQIVLGGGYDHAWILNKKEANELSLAATVVEKTSGRKMEVMTTEPAIQFYTGNFLDGKLTGKGGVNYPKRFALCLESEHYPDSPNQAAFPTTVLKPNETYKTTTIYKFSTEIN
jgi:aldose 1-epimerase